MSEVRGSEVWSWAEIKGQHAELLSARRVLSLLGTVFGASGAPGVAGGDGAGGSQGEGGGQGGAGGQGGNGTDGASVHIGGYAVGTEGIDGADASGVDANGADANGAAGANG